MNIGVVDLFCGIGGLTYGLQKTGLKVCAGIDIDSTCEYAYISNNNTKFIKKDISDVEGTEIKRLLRGFKVKVLVDCAPCQPFSNHIKDKNNRNSHKDWNLLNEYARIIQEVKPHIVSMENVPQLRNEEVFKEFLKVLSDLKYHVDYKVVDASDYGVPQRRHRLILLASKIKKIKIIEPTHLGQKLSVFDAIGDLPQVKSGEACIYDKLHLAPRLSEINIKRIRASVPGGTWRDWPDDLILKCHRKPSGRSYPSVYGRMRWDEVSPTITTQFNGYGTGRFGHPEQDRALTLREGAILQSFPKGYQFSPEDKPVVQKHIARHIGNAVPPRLGEVIGESIKIHLKKRKYTRGGRVYNE